MEGNLKIKNENGGEPPNEKRKVLKNKLILVTSKLIFIILVIALAILSQR